MKKRLLALLLVLAMVFTLALTGCSQPAEDTEEPETEEPGTEEPGEEPSEEPAAEAQELTFNWTQEPPDMDPQTSTDQVSFWLLNATLEGMVRLNPDGSIGEGLAEDYTISEDGTVYTFTLRDAKWSDGTAITAQDFEAAWIRALDPATASEYSYQFYHIVGAEEFNTGATTDPATVGIKALDEKTLEVTLLRPTPFFLSLTSFITYLPAQAAAVEEFGDAYGTEADKMVYSGPFAVDEWIHEDSLTLVKNEMYWDADTSSDRKK